ncbi:MAG: polyketide cyclase [Burkholderiales bacterium]|nr:MAG: polyketide cyclase [Betaproteobacteria bacterium]TAG84595.1 MAG: polyketide cyclase [Burkholderiales bacterium]
MTHSKNLREGEMRIALKFITYLIGLVLVVLLAGFLLPSTYSAQRSVTINAPADKVYPLVANVKAWKGWTVWNQRDPNMQLSYAGPESGVGAKWAWKSKTEGNGAMEFTAAEPNKRIAYALQMEGMTPAPGDIKFEPAGNATKVTWSMSGDAGMNPMFRWFGYFMDRLVGPDFEAGLTNLKKLAESM